MTTETPQSETPTKEGDLAIYCSECDFASPLEGAEKVKKGIVIVPGNEFKLVCPKCKRSMALTYINITEVEEKNDEVKET